MSTLGRTVMRTTVAALLLVLSVSAVLLHASLLGQLRFDGENSTMESEPLYALERCRDGKALYCDYAHPPHVITAYMPLFYVIPGWLAKQVGGSWQDMVLVGRGYVYVFWIGVGVALCALARQAECRRSLALMAGLLWGAGQLTTGWANSFKPDAAALFFSLAALWVYGRNKRLIGTVVTMGLLAVAFWHKHTAVAALFAVLEEERQRKGGCRAVALATVWALVVGAGVLAVEVVTSGRFSLNVFYGLMERAPWDWPVFLAAGSFILGFVPLAGGLLASLTLETSRCPVLLRRYFVLAIVVAVGGTLIRGTLGNHYLEPLAVGCVLMAVLVESWLAETTSGVTGWLRAGLLLCMLLMSLLPVADRVMTLRSVGSRSDEWQDFLKNYAKLKGPLLVEDSYLAIRQGTVPTMIDASKFASLQRNGLFDDAPLLRKIGEGDFRAVVTKWPLDSNRAMRPFPPRWLAAIRGRYHRTQVYLLGDRRENVYVYEPIRRHEEIGDQD